MTPAAPWQHQSPLVCGGRLRLLHGSTLAVLLEKTQARASDAARVCEVDNIIEPAEPPLSRDATQPLRTRCGDCSSNSFKYCCHTAAQVWVP